MGRYLVLQCFRIPSCCFMPVPVWQIVEARPSPEWKPVEVRMEDGMADGQWPLSD